VLTLAHPRARWSRRLTSWATTGALDLQHQPCLTVAEVRRRIGDGSIRAVLADGRLSHDDSDLCAVADSAGVALIRVDAETGATPGSPSAPRPSLASDFGPDDLLAVLPEISPDRPPIPPSRAPVTHRSGRVVAVTGSGGTGVSTTAALLAVGSRRPDRSVLLVDLSVGADQALLNGLAEVVPGLGQAMTDDRRLGRDLPDCVHRCAGGFDLVPGAPFGRQVDLEPGPLRRMVGVAGAAYDETILDLSPAALLMLALSPAPAEDAPLFPDRVVVVARPDVSGLHRLCRLLSDLGDVGGRDRVIVLNGVTPRPRPSGSVITGTRRLLAAAGLDPDGPIMAGRHRRGLRGRLRDGRPPGRRGLPLPAPERTT